MKTFGGSILFLYANIPLGFCLRIHWKLLNLHRLLRSEALEYSSRIPSVRHSPILYEIMRILNIMRKLLFILCCIACLPVPTMAQMQDSIIGRAYSSFDLTAFCSYNNFHPSEYLTDNNWNILCAFVQPGTTAKLDSLGIKYNKSQLRLLEVGDLLTCHNNVYTTNMHIFGKGETQQIRRESKEFADSIFPIIEPKIKVLISAFAKAGYSKQTYSLVFSYLLDGYIWGDEYLSSPLSCENHGTWSGAYWAMFESRDHDKVGTNGYGPLIQNWTDNLGYWLNSNKMIAFAKEVMRTQGNRIDNQDVIQSIAGWGLTDSSGNILIPVIHRNNKDNIDLLCQAITAILSDAVKNHCVSWSKAHNITSLKLAQIIFYHEVIWDLLDILESRGMISMPAILKGEDVGKEHFGEICFIVIDTGEK